MIWQAVERRIKSFASKAGVEIRRLPDAYAEQVRLLSGTDVKTIYEVGAANGRDCLRYTQLFPKSTVYAFEPLPASFAKIPKHPRIAPINAAVSSIDGRAMFNVAASPDSSSLYATRYNGSVYNQFTGAMGTVEVEVMSLNGFAATHPAPDLLKIDAQGAELEILRGGDTLSPRLIFIEVQFNALYEGTAEFPEIASLLASRGYRLHNLYGISSDLNRQIAWADAIFLAMPR